MSTIPDRGPFQFDVGGHALYGFLEAPRAGQSRQTGVVLCQPTGHEYVRCHRACRQLATRLVRSGYPVLRFDYRGSGDSEGESDTVRFEDWVEDITGAEGLLGVRGVSRTCLVGLRLGATLAMMADARVQSHAAVLWQPVVDGRSYLEEMRGMDRAHRHEYGLDADGNAAAAGPGTTEILGFLYGRKMLEQIAKVNPGMFPERRSGPTLVVDNTEDGRLNDFPRQIRDSGDLPDYRHIPGREWWLAEPHRAVMPHESVQTVVKWISEVCP